MLIGTDPTEVARPIAEIRLDRELLTIHEDDEINSITTFLLSDGADLRAKANTWLAEW